jgi:hypothetical protein
MAPGPEQFRLSIPETTLADLNARLATTRFPDQAPDDRWAYGTDLKYLRGLVGYWKDSFDWRAQEVAQLWPPRRGSAADAGRELSTSRVSLEAGSEAGGCEESQPSPVVHLRRETASGRRLPDMRIVPVELAAQSKTKADPDI